MRSVCGRQITINAKNGVYACPGYMEDDTFVHGSKTFEMKEVSRHPLSE